MSRITSYFVPDQKYSVDQLIKVSTHQSGFMGGFLDSILEIDEQRIEILLTREQDKNTDEWVIVPRAKWICSFKNNEGLCIFYNFLTNKYESYHYDHSKSGIVDIEVKLPRYSWGIKQRFFFNQLLLKITLGNECKFSIYNKDDEDGLNYAYSAGEYSVKMIPDDNYRFDRYGVDTVLHSYDNYQNIREHYIIMPLYHIWTLSAEQIMFDFFGTDYVYLGQHTVNIGKDWVLDKRPLLI